MKDGEKNETRKEAIWQYYTNEENRPRWKCSERGKIIRHGAHEKLFCSRCGSRMTLES